MALLDTVHLLLVFLTGLHVPPTLTVILVQFTLPLTALLTQFTHPDGCGKGCCCCGGGREREVSNDCGPSTNGNYSNQDRLPPREIANEATPLMGCQDGRSIPSGEIEIVEGFQVSGCGGLCWEHIFGSVIISIAVLCALCPAMYSILDPDFFIYADQIPLQTAYNTMLFVSSCIPAAASQLYKEQIFLQYKQPVQADHLNFILSVFQLIFATIMAPLVFGLQGLGARGDWYSLYPSKDFSKNFIEGFQCFMGTLDEARASDGYSEPASCDYSLALVLINAFAIILVGVAVDKIVNAGATKVMYRGVSAGILLSVSCLYSYDMHIPQFNYGPAIDSLNFVCLLLLVLGSEVYHRVSLQDATFQTLFPEIENFYDDGE
jgi:CRT-like, chloroquine-resistance transporter-like